MQYTANSLENHWMPFSSNRDFKDNPRLIVKAEGCYYWDHKGGKIIDGSSGLFCVALGHGRPEIADAVHAQLNDCDYVPPFQLGHPAAFELASKVAKILPEDMNHVFFCNSGSESIDTALKIVMAYHRANGEGHRNRFVSREKAYHGVNIGGVSLAGLMKNREAFTCTMPNVVHMRHTWMPENRFVKGQPEHGAELAEDLQRMCDNYGGTTIAACFVEPIAGSTGCLVPPKGYLDRLREICDANGILLVFDEVICGFGRTGKAFAAQSFGVTPDIITMAKALTNGAQPMGAVAVRDELYDTVVNSSAYGAIEFFHGYTFSAHPAACAAGLATQNIFEKENVFARAESMTEFFLDKLWELEDLDDIVDLRGYGLLGAFDLKPGDTPGARGPALQKELFWKGLHIKFTGDTGLIAPPLVATQDEISEMIEVIRATLTGN